MSDSSRRRFLQAVSAGAGFSTPVTASGLDPKARIHMPIGIPDSLDTLKTFVEAEGNFSPGAGTYGIYFWLLDTTTGGVIAPTMSQIPLEYGLNGSGLLIPWSKWRACGVEVTTSVCQVEGDSVGGAAQLACAKVSVLNPGSSLQRVSLLVALRPLGAAGGDVHALRCDLKQAALFADGHLAVVADRRPSFAAVLETDSIGNYQWSALPANRRDANSATGDCSGALRFDFSIPPGKSETLGLLCPVLPGRTAARHRWVDLKQNAMADLAELDPKSGGLPQPEPSLASLKRLRMDVMFRKASTFWEERLSGIDVTVPDPRWRPALRAIAGHAAMCMNEGAPDVAVLNYNVFNRDGMYIANIMQKSGLMKWSESILDYFLSHPFNGRAYPEADNPGQILWAMEQHWLLTRDTAWLGRAYPSATQIARLVEYYRFSPGPHWVSMNSLDFGEAVAPADRQELKPGRCDGYNPEYTEAFDVAGLRAAQSLASAAGDADAAQHLGELARSLARSYDERFGTRLANKYGSYCVLWPCRLYELRGEKAQRQFRGLGAQELSTWRYFALATAHQSLLAGNREAGHQTLDIHLSHEQMKGWFVLDEGGKSGSGTWRSIRTNWTHSKSKPGENLSVAMPHGWAIAEFWLLMRDCLAFEDEGCLVLLAGIPPGWFRHRDGLRFRALPTHFGRLTLDYKWTPSGFKLALSGCSPPGGFRLCLPRGLSPIVSAGGSSFPVDPDGACLIPARTSDLTITYG